MIVTTWNNGDNHASGAGYGFRVDIIDRDRYFRREWGLVVLHLQGRAEPVIVNIDKDSFLGLGVQRADQQGDWTVARLNNMAPWPKDHPPKLIMKPTRANEFDVGFVNAQ